MRTSVIILLWFAWACALVGIVDWTLRVADTIDKYAAGGAVLAMYFAGAIIGVKVFSTIWPKPVPATLPERPAKEQGWEGKK